MSCGIFGKYGRVMFCLKEDECFFFLSMKQGGSTPALIKAEVPWSARRGHLSEEERVLKTVKGYFILFKLLLWNAHNVTMDF